MEKYIILDFGRVLAYPPTGYWQITPKFLKLIDISKIDTEQLKNAIKKYNSARWNGRNWNMIYELKKCNIP